MATTSSAPRRPVPPAPGILDEKLALARVAKIHKWIFVQAVIIVALTVSLMIAIPLCEPLYIYYALRSDKATHKLVPLDVPNMTNSAILSWASSSVTEIMTIGFGDLAIKLPKQRWRFTSAGWDAFTTAFKKAGLGETFRQSQLVLTTVPSAMPMIVAQGTNADQTYEWDLQIPIVMSYATNNEVTNKQNHILWISIIRVPSEDSIAGIAIKGWRQIQ